VTGPCRKFNGAGNARPHQPRPFQYVAARADNAARRLELALIEETHGERRGVPAARREAAQDRALRGFLIEMEWLRIEFGGKGFYPRSIDPQTNRVEFLAHDVILEIVLGHCFAQVLV
jgi:hypothetical protein